MGVLKDMLGELPENEDGGLLSPDELRAMVDHAQGVATRATNELAALRARLAAAEESEKALEMAIAGIRAEHVHWSAYAARHRGVSADGRAWGLEFALRKLDALAAPAAAQPAAPSPGLVWTSESPKVAGRRWYRRKNGHEEIVRVTDLDLDIIDQPWAGWHGSQWAGPIPEPQEPADAGGGGE